MRKQRRHGFIGMKMPSTSILIAGVALALASAAETDSRPTFLFPVPLLELKAETYVFVEGRENPVLSERATVLFSGGQSRVECEKIAEDSGQVKQTEVSIFDGAQYRKLTTFAEKRQPLGWQGGRDLNIRLGSALLYGALALDEMIDMNDPSKFRVSNPGAGLLMIERIEPPPLRVYMDPAHGNLVKRIEWSDDAGTVTKIVNVDFAKTDEQWWPAEIRTDSMLDGKMSPESLVRITSIKRDPPVPAGAFQIEFPEGTRVMSAEVTDEEIENVRRESGIERPDAGLGPRTAERVQTQAPSAKSNEPNASPTPAVRKPQTTDGTAAASSPRPVREWIAPRALRVGAVAVVLLAAIVLWTVWRKRRSS